MCAKLVVVFIVVSFNGCVLDRAVHALNLTIDPRMVWPGQPVLVSVGVTDHVEPHGPGIDCVAVARLLGELDAVVRQNRVDAVRYGFQKMLKEFPRRLAIGLLHQLRNGELAGSVNGHKEKKLSFFGSDFGDVDMKIANEISFALLPFGLVPIRVWKA